MADTAKAVCVDKRGFIYMVEGTTPHCEKYDDEGVSKLTFTTNVPVTPTGIFVDDRGYIYISEAAAIWVFDDEGNKVKSFVT